MNKTVPTGNPPFIPARFPGAASDPGKAFEVRNPARPEEIVATVAACAPADVERAVSAASDAARAWSSVSPVARAEILLAAARHMRAEVEALARLETREMGKPIGEARGEVGAGVGFLEYFAGEAVRMSGDLVGSVRDRVQLRVTREPIGVAALVTPWNFPISIPTKKMAASLASGNASIMKPASLAPGVAGRIVDILLEAGVPEGALNFVPGSGEAAGAALVGDPRVGAISFTGSTAVGWGTVALAGSRHATVQAEMGGKNAAVVWEDSDLDRAVALVVDGAFRSAGQKCTATSRVIVHRPIRARFVEALLRATEGIVVGDPLDEMTFMGPVVDAAQLQKVERYVEIGNSEGATLLAGGTRLQPRGVESGYFYAPTIFDDVEPDMRIAREEIFGPVLAILTCDTIEDAISMTNDTEYGLAAVIHTASLARAEAFMQGVDVGCAGVNVTTAGWELQAPFGGTKSSGFGVREQGPGAIDFFTRRKTLAVGA